VILCGFAVIVGVLTTRRIQADFNQQVAEAADQLAKQTDLQLVQRNNKTVLRYRGPSLGAYASAQHAVVRVVTEDNEVIKASPDAPYLSPPLAPTLEFAGFRVESRPVKVEPVGGVGFVQYARRLSDVQDTANRVRFFLVLGVLGGTALALLAGVATARRAMTPIAELTETARTIERTRDPSRRIPHPEAEDEVAELARTLDGMLHALDQARSETESTLTRQREFVAAASRCARRGGCGASWRTCCCSRAPTRGGSRATSPSTSHGWSRRRPASSSRCPRVTRSRSPLPRAPRSPARATSCTGWR
jgi:HAMP domain-containing protein